MVGCTRIIFFALFLFFFSSGWYSSFTNGGRLRVTLSDMLRWGRYQNDCTIWPHYPRLAQSAKLFKQNYYSVSIYCCKILVTPECLLLSAVEVVLEQLTADNEVLLNTFFYRRNVCFWYCCCFSNRWFYQMFFSLWIDVLWHSYVNI